MELLLPTVPYKMKCEGKGQKEQKSPACIYLPLLSLPRQLWCYVRLIGGKSLLLLYNFFGGINIAVRAILWPFSN